MKRLFNQTKFVTLCIATSVMTGCANMPIPAGMTGMSAPNAPYAPMPRYGMAQGAMPMSMPNRLLDKEIERMAKANIYGKYPELRFNSRIEVDSLNGNVLLTGEVPNEQIKKGVQNTFLTMDNVKGLFNELKVGRRRTMSYNVHDAYITSQIKSKIMLNPVVPAYRIKVVTETGVVYIMGKLNSVEKQEIIRIVDMTPAVMELIFLTNPHQTTQQQPAQQPMQQPVQRQPIPDY